MVEYLDQSDNADKARAEYDRIGAEWIQRIRAVEKREDDFIKSAEGAEQKYLCGQVAAKDGGIEGAPRFNILYSNVETIIPAIYNSTPAPDIRPRHNVNDPALKELSDAFERAIATQVDDEKLDVEIEKLAQDTEVAGRAVTRVRFDVSGDGVNGAKAIYENVSWKDYREGPGKKWADVPWVAYRHTISKAEYARITSEDASAAYASDAELEEVDCDIWEIWSKENRQVLFVDDQKSRLLNVLDDPLGLPGFFCQPEPVVPLCGTGGRMPVVPFDAYSELTNELETITTRISVLTKGLRVRGAFAGNAEIVEEIANLGDNELVAVADLQGLTATGGLTNAVMWWPIDVCIAVLRELYQNRDSIIQSIYEITGISDIVRGNTDARETAAAQKIKTQWGSQRVKRKQRMIQSHIRDLFKITAEIMVARFSPESFAAAAGVPMTAEDGSLSPVIQEFVMLQQQGGLDHLRIDIESDSTIRADLDKQRGEMARFLEATGGFFAVMGPLVQDKPEMAPAALEMFNAFARSFQLGKQTEDAIDDLAEMARNSAQAGGENDPESQERQFELQLKQVEMATKEGELRVRQQEAQTRRMAAETKMRVEEKRAQVEYMKLQMEAVSTAQEAGLKIRQQDLAELQAQLDAMLAAEEVELEREQMRPVALG